MGNTFTWRTGNLILVNPDRPRSLATVTERKNREANLHQTSHMKPLVRYAEALRDEKRGQVPDFDPFDGGVEAEILFLFEKPGPKTDPSTSGSGFVSRDNDDPTAEAIFHFMSKARIPRQSTLIWNLIPWWNGQIKYSAEERRSGLLRLEYLLNLLPRLRSVVAVGKQAQTARFLCENRKLGYFPSLHPSPRNRAARPSEWRAIPETWSHAWRQNKAGDGQA